MRFLLCTFSLVIFLSACKEPVIQYPVGYNVGEESFMKFSQERGKFIREEEEKLIKKYISEQELEFKETSFGFWISNSGIPSETMAKNGDAVLYEYEISDFNDSVIYSYKENGIRTSVLGKEDLPRGLHAALQLIESGDSALALLPSFSAFGVVGDNEKIESDKPVVFKIKILEINKTQK